MPRSICWCGRRLAWMLSLTGDLNSSSGPPPPLSSAVEGGARRWRGCIGFRISTGLCGLPGDRLSPRGSGRRVTRRACPWPCAEGEGAACSTPSSKPPHPNSLPRGERVQGVPLATAESIEPCRRGNFMLDRWNPKFGMPLKFSDGPKLRRAIFYGVSDRERHHFKASHKDDGQAL